jgi:hypothetical protein
MRSAEPVHPAERAGRDELEARQRSLVAALVAGAEPPADMDADRIRVQAAALVHKRARAVARAQPELAAALGPDFGAAFRGYATGRPGPAPGCTAADAEDFARYLDGSGHSRNRAVRHAARRVAGNRRKTPAAFHALAAYGRSARRDVA